MHEISIADNLLRQLTKIAKGKEVKSVCVEIGCFRNIDLESLEFAISNLKDNYPLLTKCVFEYKLIKALAICYDNNHSYEPEFARGFKCNQCSSGVKEIIQGEEFNLVNIFLNYKI